MTPKLSDEQRQAVALHPGQPVKILDPDTHLTYYLISDDQFGRVRCLIERDEFDVRETYAAQDRALGKVWDDPALDIYNEPESPPQT